MNAKHRTRVQIRFNGIDLMGHVYNAKYQEFFDLAPLEYFDDVLGNLISWDNEGLIIASVKVDFMEPTFLNDQIEVEMHISSVGEKSLVMTQQLFKNGKQEAGCKCPAVMVCYNMKEKFSKNILTNWKAKIATCEPELTIN
jgi:acyl-CoA thioester hydrolase